MLSRRPCLITSLALWIATALWFQPVATFSSHLLPVRLHAHAVGAHRINGNRNNRVNTVRLATARRKTDASRSVGMPALDFPPPPLQARAAFLLDMQTGAVLYAKNPDLRLPMASTTKITTAVLALEYLRLNTHVRVSRAAASIGESTMGLQQGERLTVRQLLYGLMLNSGNDAAIALAERVAGSVKRFVVMMNVLARSLHMRHTHYATPHGLDAPHHFSSARDLATIAAYAMRDPVFRRIVATTSYHVRATKHNHEHWLASVNRVMFWYPGVDGVKPGDTDLAGLCQVVSVRRDGHHLLAVLLNTPTLVNDVRNLLNYGLQDFRWIQSTAWWDAPSAAATGVSHGQPWLYFYGAGHYIRGAFLHYYQTHGGLETLGYPRTEAYVIRGQVIQYFEGGVLAYDAPHGNAYPLALGAWQARQFVPWARSKHHRVSASFARIYKQLGGRGVLGLPVTPLTTEFGYPTQFFQYGQLEMAAGIAYVVPIGDAELRLQKWLPRLGAADALPNTMSPWLVARIHGSEVGPYPF